MVSPAGPGRSSPSPAADSGPQTFPTSRGPSHAAGGLSSWSWPRAALEMSGKDRATLVGGEVRADPLRRFVLDPRLTFIQAAELRAPSKGKQDLLPSCCHTHPRTRSACHLTVSRTLQALPSWALGFLRHSPYEKLLPFYKGPAAVRPPSHRRRVTQGTHGAPQSRVSPPADNGARASPLPQGLLP